MDMRGLSTFIAEIRKASSNPDGEKDCVSKELAKIRAKFRESKDLSGYDRKKYICKLLYIFMLGYEIDFGHMEALRLLSGSRYTEKHIGYLACTILLHESHELLTLITNQVKMDLNSGKEFYQCLALTAIANLGGTEFAEAMAHDVQRLVIAADTRSNVRKKAALTLLRLFRKYSDIIQPEVIVAPILELLVTPDFGVVNCALSLLLGLLGKCDINLFEGCTQKCIRILSRIVLGKETPHDYIYFGVPTPWVQMKALRVLQHYPPLSDATQHGQIMNILQKIIAASEKLLKDISLTMNKTSRGMLNRSNAMNGVLLEALSLAMHYDCDVSLLESTASILGRLVNEKRDTNMRYLGLSLLSRLSFCQSINFHESIREHQSIILNSLRDPDISIRRRALDLLYCMCDTNNAGDIVGELLEYLPISDYQIREDLVLKIAILSEKYSTDLSWYVNVILNVLTQAGDYVGEDVWYRLCQIVTNNPTIQKQAAEMVFTAVSPVTADETLVKVASYVLGEYGDLIARNPETNPNAQFQALNNKYLLVSPSTRTLILTCYLKLFNMFTNVTLREKIKKIFDENRSHLDPELQQRAQEYYLLCTEHESILPSVIDTMLPFVLRDTNAVFSAVSTAKGKSIAEKDVGQKKATEGENVDPAETAFLSENVLNGGDAIVTTDPPKKQINQMDDLFAQSASPPQIQTHQSIAPAATSSIDSLFGGGSTEPPHLNASAARKAVPEALPGSGAGAGAGAGLLEDIFGTSSGNGAPGALGEYVNAKAQEEVTSRWRALCATRQGILYEDDRVQVGCLHEYNGFNGRMTLYYGNKSVAAIENFSTSLEKTGHNLQLQIQNIANKIGAKQQIQQQVALLCGGVFTEEETPQLRITFMSSGLSTKLVLPLPVVAGRFTEPIAELSNKASFMQQWGNLSGPEAVVLTGCTRSLDISSLDQTLKNVLRMSTLRVDDVNPNNLAVACSFSITGQQGAQRSAVLIMLEVNPSASAARVSVRTVNPYISFAYINLMKLVFGVNQ